MPAPDVAALLSELERSDPDVADAARLAVEWLTGGEALETIAQLDVCEFLWYTLPVKVSGGDDEHAGIARALGRLLRLGGMERYASLCSSPVTVQILRAYGREGEDAGMAAYQRALEATGVLPPAVPELSWSSIMGPEELGAHVACSAALELAIVSGELEIGAGAWKQRREELTRRWLTTARAELGGDSWLQRVHGERLNRWVLGRGAARRDLAQPFEVRLHASVPAPRQTHLDALRWLLELGVKGVSLTQKHNIARALVVEAAERFGWDTWAPSVPRTESQVPALVTLHAIAQTELRALRRTGRTLTITATGRRLLGDGERLWEAAASALVTPARGEHEFEVSTREIALMILAEGRPVGGDELRTRVAEVLTEDGWLRHAAPGVDSLHVGRSLAELRRRLDAFGLRVIPDRWNGPDHLTPIGQAAALAALRAQALRPRQYVSLG
jgi:hypothetical protein